MDYVISPKLLSSAALFQRKYLKRDKLISWFNSINLQDPQYSLNEFISVYLLFEQEFPFTPELFNKIIDENNGLPGINTIQSLKLSIAQPTLEGLQELAQWVIGNENISYFHLQSEALNLTYFPPLCSIIENSRSIQKLQLSNCFKKNRRKKLEALFNSLATNSTITSLNLSSNALELNGAKLICSFLLENQSIKKLNLSNNSLSDAAAMVLSKLFRGNKSSLISLNLNQNRLDTRGVRAIMESLDDNSILQILKLSNSRISNQLAFIHGLGTLDLAVDNVRNSSSCMFSFLVKQPTLRILDLQDCKLDEEQLCLVFNYLKENHCLQRLSVAGSVMGRKSSISLKNLLLVNSSLTCLNLSNIPMEPQFFSIVCQGLASNYSIQHLLLQKCSIHDEMAILLLESLKNSSIRTIDLSKNYFSGAIYEKLAEFLEINNSIDTMLFQETNEPPEPVKEMIVKSMENNTSLCCLEIPNCDSPNALLERNRELRNNKRFRRMKIAC